MAWACPRRRRRSACREWVARYPRRSRRSRANHPRAGRRQAGRAVARQLGSFRERAPFQAQRIGRVRRKWQAERLVPSAVREVRYAEHASAKHSAYRDHFRALTTTGSILRFTDGRRSGSGAASGLRFQTTPRGLRPRGGPGVLKYISTFRSGDARGAAAGRGGRAGRRKSALLAPAPACRPALEREFQAVALRLDDNLGDLADFLVRKPL